MGVHALSTMLHGVGDLSELLLHLARDQAKLPSCDVLTLVLPRLYRYWLESSMTAKFALVFALISILQCASCQWKCGAKLYGRPTIPDCASALISMPEGGSRTPSRKLLNVRPFIEPQFLSPPFDSVDNDLGTEIEQIPKFWRYRSCRVALMATADSRGEVIDPIPLSTWAFIEHEALKVSRNCLGARLGGGIVLIAGMKTHTDSGDALEADPINRPPR